MTSTKPLTKAAPDLLEALLALMTMLWRYKRHSDIVLTATEKAHEKLVWRAAIAAVNKATGG